MWSYLSITSYIQLYNVFETSLNSYALEITGMGRFVNPEYVMQLLSQTPSKDASQSPS